MTKQINLYSPRLSYDMFPADNNPPCILFVHGGGFVGGSKDNTNLAGVEAFQKDGFSVARMNYTLATKGSPTFRQAPLDVLNCIANIKANYNPSDIYLVGTSAGATIALQAALTNPTVISKLALLYGIYDFTRSYRDLMSSPTNVQDMLDIYLGSDKITCPKVKRSVAQLLSPLHISKMKPFPRTLPTFIAHGASDPVVNCVQSRILVQHLIFHHKNIFGYKEYPKVGHGFNPTNPFCYTDLIGFFNAS